jgi:hypothetical protein
VESAFAWVRDADADTTIEKSDGLTPWTGPSRDAYRRGAVRPATVAAWGFVLAQTERAVIVARLVPRRVLVPTSPTVPSPDGVVVGQLAGGFPIRLRPRALSNVKPVSPS